MATISEALTIALDHHLAGRGAEAEILYRRILEVEPRQPDALHLLGVLAGQAGDVETAAALIGEAIAANPTSADYHLNLANLLRPAGRIEEAARHYADALRLAPDRDDALEGFALTAARLGSATEGEEAGGWYRRALAVQPSYADVLFNLASLAHDDGGALPFYDRAARLSGDPVARHRQADILMRLGRRAEAADAYRAVLAADPDLPDLRSALWELERSLGRYAAYHAHDGQDAFIHETFFPTLRNGCFLDIGAFDGVMWSNTLFFEREMGWTGLCVEASPTRFAALRQARSSTCLNVALSDFEGEAEFLDIVNGPVMMGGLYDAFGPGHRAFVESITQESRRITVPVRRLDRLLAEHGITHVHYCSIDVEGAELRIVDSVDFSRVTIDVFTLENIDIDPAIPAHMAELGYDLVCRFGGRDEVYARRGLPRLR